MQLAILEKQQFDFSSLQASTSTVFVVHRAIDVMEWPRAALQVRVHSVDIGTNASIDVKVDIVSQTPEDPGVDFVLDGTSVSIDDAVTAPTLLEPVVLGGMGAALRLSIEGNQASTPTNVKATISADLILKPRVVPPLT